MIGMTNFQIRKVLLKNRQDLQSYLFRQSSSISTIPIVKIINIQSNNILTLKIQQCREKLNDYLKLFLNQKIVLGYLANILSTCLYLASQFGCFALTSNLVRFDYQKKLKVWIHQDLFVNQPQFPLINGSSGQKAMMKSILAIFKPYLKSYQKLTGLENIRDLQVRILEISLKNGIKSNLKKQKHPYSQKILKLPHNYQSSSQNVICSAGQIKNYNLYKQNDENISNEKKTLQSSFQESPLSCKLGKGFPSSQNLFTKEDQNNIKRSNTSKTPLKILRKTDNYKNHHTSQTTLETQPISIEVMTRKIESNIILKQNKFKKKFSHEEQTTLHSIRQNILFQDSKASSQAVQNIGNILDSIDSPDSKVSCKTKATNDSLQQQLNKLFIEDEQYYGILYKQIEKEFIGLL